MRRAGEETRYRRDATGNPVAITRASDGASVTLAYDVEDRLDLHRDAQGRETRWDYAGLPFPVRRHAPDGGVLAYEYTRTLDLAALINGKGERTTFRHDAAGRLVEEIGFDGRRQLYRYDASGVLIERQDGAGMTRHIRDSNGQIERTELPDGTAHLFSWNAAGWLTAASTPERDLAWTYGAAGNLLSEVQDGATLTHRYDARGRRIATSLPDGRVIDTDWTPAMRSPQCGWSIRPSSLYCAIRWGAWWSARPAACLCSANTTPPAASSASTARRCTMHGDGQSTVPLRPARPADGDDRSCARREALSL